MAPSRQSPRPGGTERVPQWGRAISIWQVEPPSLPPRTLPLPSLGAPSLPRPWGPGEEQEAVLGRSGPPAPKAGTCLLSSCGHTGSAQGKCGQRTWSVRHPLRARGEAAGLLGPSQPQVSDGSAANPGGIAGPAPLGTFLPAPPLGSRAPPCTPSQRQLGLCCAAKPCSPSAWPPTTPGQMYQVPREETTKPSLPPAPWDRSSLHSPGDAPQGGWSDLPAPD